MMNRHPRTGRSRLSPLFALLLPLVLVACGEETIYSGLTERQVNEMVALLHKVGVPASKTRGSDGAYAIATPAKHFGAAVETLEANGLPADHYDSLGDVFAKQGLVSSPLEERARLNHALSQEIARTISSIDGVLLARVHLAVPERQPLSDRVSPASASVFVKHRSDIDLTGSISRIKALVVNGIENLPYENVTVAMFEARPAGVIGVPASLSVPMPAQVPQPLPSAAPSPTPSQLPLQASGPSPISASPVAPATGFVNTAATSSGAGHVATMPTALASMLPNTPYGGRELVAVPLGLLLLIGIVALRRGRRRQAVEVKA